MRGVIRRHLQEDEEESSFVSMTDMTVSFLFIVIILLAFFASQLHKDDAVPRAEHERVIAERDELMARNQQLEIKLQELTRQVIGLERLIAERNAEIGQLKARIEELEKELLILKKQDPLEAYLKRIAEQRSLILERLRRDLKLDFPELQVIVSAEKDALRFKGDGLFESSSWTLNPDKRRIVEGLADRLNTLLPCYTLGPKTEWKEDCNPIGAVIEAVQIEGHTDATGSDNTNLTLSTSRANETFFAMIERQPELTAYMNTQSQPVLSVAGYGEMRPVEDNNLDEGRATNRRIDLRIIMYTPRSLEDIERVESELQRALAVEPVP